MKKSAKRIRLPTVKKSWFSAAARTVSGSGDRIRLLLVYMPPLALREDGYETIMVNS